MSRTKWIVGSLVALTLVVLVGVPVYAHCGKCADSFKQMCSMMDAGKMSLAKAIDIAEKEAKGRAVAAHCELEDGGLEIEVYVLVGGKIMEVEIDGTTGKVTEMELAEAHYLDFDDDDDDDDDDHGNHHGHDHG